MNKEQQFEIGSTYQFTLKIIQYRAKGKKAYFFGNIRGTVQSISDGLIVLTDGSEFTLEAVQAGMPSP